MHSRNLIFALFVSIFSVIAVSAQTDNWNAVQSLSAGTNIIVETESGTELKAKFSSAGPDSILFRSEGRSVTLGRGDIARVYLTRRGSRLKRAMWGAAAGAGIGTAVGAGVVAATKGDGLAAAGGFLYGIPAGAAIGALTTGRKRGDLIYSSR